MRFSGDSFVSPALVNDMSVTSTDKSASSEDGCLSSF